MAFGHLVPFLWLLSLEHIVLKQTLEAVIFQQLSPYLLFHHSDLVLKRS